MRILVIRRDNIGDLVCTTPVFGALRQQYPHAFIAALVNSYCAPVLDGNPALDAVYVYTKAKHESSQSRLATWGTTALLLWKLRAMRFDVAIAIGDAAATMAAWLKPGRVIRAGDESGPDIVPSRHIAPLHAVEAAFAFLQPLGVTLSPGPLVVGPAGDRVSRLKSDNESRSQPVIGLHLSARKPSQRWPVDRFAALARVLAARHDAAIRVFWSPGSQSNAFHPGDDEKAERLLAQCEGLRLRLCPSTELADLVAGMALCDLVICGDGGAMHIAAGLGKPVVALFGDSDPQRWRPWDVPCRVLQPPSRNVADLSLEEVAAAAGALLVETCPATSCA
ncbi:MAG: glycosyltransferase family 9 protein [Betaproteobacteria bacterium]|nr:glycosyltransferase family 9 protein [Betaproteobacteria bacterium]